jgi:hypothetical protein
MSSSCDASGAVGNAPLMACFTISHAASEIQTIVRGAAFWTPLACSP